jgi:DNA-binding response OmpR family regulator
MKKVMVVDDDPDIIYSIREGLYTEFNIISAESGMQCLRMLETEIPDIILLDIMMPHMSGWETLDRIRKKQSLRNIPIVFITARTDKNAKNAGGFLGDDYIEKPFEINDLKVRIDKILNTKNTTNYKQKDTLKILKE